jgi:general secretion pathway protein D
MSVHSSPTFSAVPTPSERSESYSFTFHDAEISQVAAEILGKALGLSYVIDPGVTGKMSFQIEKRLTGAQLLQAFEAVLESNDVSLIREGDSIAVKPRAKAKAAAAVRPLSDGIRGAGYQTLAVPLDFALPSEVAKALQAVTGEDIVVHVDDKLGFLVLGGAQSQLQSAVETIRLFDRNGFEGAKIRFFNLQQAAAQTVASDLSRIVDAAKISGVTIVPLKRLNGLFVVAQSAAAVDQVNTWINRLDVPSREKTLGLWIYRPRNLSAEALATALNGVMGTQSAFVPSAGPAVPLTGAAASGSSGAQNQQALAAYGAPMTGPAAATNLSSEDDPVRIGVDKQSNTLLFSASEAHWIQIQRTVNDLDRTPSQVLIEASILEVTLGNHFNYGVDWSVLGSKGRLNVSSINSGSGPIAPTAPGLSVTFIDTDVQAAISALREETAVTVVSSPKIVALDNHEANLEVGDSVPVTTQVEQSVATAGAPILNSVSYRSTGVILKVTPRISGDGRVMLDINQEVSSVTRTTSSRIDSPTIQTRKVATALMLADGGMVALGGLISSNNTITDGGIPYLKSIPVAGALFKARSNNRDRTELIVLISARVLSNDVSSSKATADLLADMKEITARGLDRR